MNNKKYSVKKFYFLLISFLSFFTISIIFFSGYYNYGAESISLSNIQRIIKGLPHITSLGSVPEMIGPYGGLFSYLIGIPLKIISFHHIIWINFIAKLFIILSIIFNLKILNFIEKKYISKEKGINHYIYFVGAYVFLVFPFLSISFRPDFVALIFELLGILFFLNHLEEKNNNFKSLLLSTLFFSIAPQFKLTHIFALVCSGLYLLIKSKYKSFLILFLGSLSLVVSFLFLSHLIFQDTYIEQLFYAANMGLISMSALSSTLSQLVNIIFFKFFPIHILFILGFNRYRKRSNHSLYFLLILASTLIFGIIAQIKVGAFFNYFYLLIFIEALFIKEGIQELQSCSKDIRKSFNFFTIIIFCLLMLDGFKNIAIVFGNSYRNYPYKVLKNYIQTHHSKAKIYTPNSNIAVHFQDQVLLGPWVEETYLLSKKIQINYLSSIKEKLKQAHFDIAIIAGSKCSNWKPSGIFYEEIKHLVLNHKKFKNLCVFKSNKI